MTDQSQSPDHSNSAHASDSDTIDSSDSDTIDSSDSDASREHDTESIRAQAERYAIEPTCTHEEFLAVVKVYARDVVDRHGLSVRVSDLEWEVSKRAKRRAGAVTYRDGDPKSVVLTWRQFENQGWVAVAETIRHELVHVHLLNDADDPSHGPAFEALAAELETSVHCDRFTEPTWWVVCTDCAARLARYRRSKLVNNPESYACGECGGAFRVEEN